MPIGETLAQARRRAGLTVAQVSEQTRIREAVIEGIEGGDYSACGGDFYARANIRSIARAVGADSGALISEYDAHHRARGALSAVSLEELLAPSAGRAAPPAGPAHGGRTSRVRLCIGAAPGGSGRGRRVGGAAPSAPGALAELDRGAGTAGGGRPGGLLPFLGLAARGGRPARRRETSGDPAAGQARQSAPRAEAHTRGRDARPGAETHSGGRAAHGARPGRGGASADARPGQRRRARSRRRQRPACPRRGRRRSRGRRQSRGRGQSGGRRQSRGRSGPRAGTSPPAAGARPQARTRPGTGAARSRSGLAGPPSAAYARRPSREGRASGPAPPHRAGTLRVKTARHTGPEPYA